jgi:hypothetical protein
MRPLKRQAEETTDTPSERPEGLVEAPNNGAKALVVPVSASLKELFGLYEPFS